MHETLHVKQQRPRKQSHTRDIGGVAHQITQFTWSRGCNILAPAAASRPSSRPRHPANGQKVRLQLTLIISNSCPVHAQPQINQIIIALDSNTAQGKFCTKNENLVHFFCREK